MQMVDPEILAAAQGLSPVLYAVGLMLGLALWLFGWKWHRFWTVLAITVVAGVYGLSDAAPAMRAQPLVAGVLLALAAGMLALSLARLMAFGAGGFAALLAQEAWAPAWDQPLVCFLAGAILGLLLFRLWLMALTSLGGTLLMVYAGVCLGALAFRTEPATWVGHNARLLNWVCGGVALLGVLVQFLLARKKKPKPKAKKPEEKKPEKKEEPPPPKKWWAILPLRKAG
jgi:hypothetical protein